MSDDPIARLRELAWPGDKIFYDSVGVTVWAHDGRVRLTGRGYTPTDAAERACIVMADIRDQARDEARKWMLAFDARESLHSARFLRLAMNARHHDHNAPGVVADVVDRIELAHVAHIEMAPWAVY